MIPDLDALNPVPAGTKAGSAFNKVVLKLVKRGPERRAIEAGEVDAVLDPESGSAILLPAAQRWLLGRAAHARAEAPAPDQAARINLDILDGLPAEICALDATGTVLSANRAWRDAPRTSLGAGIAEGDSLLVACDKAYGPDQLDGIALAAGIRQVIAGERRAFRYEHVYGPQYARRCFIFKITPAAGDAAAAGAIVSREDITWHKRGEQLLALEGTVASSLAAADDATGAVKTVIRAACESQGWECGRYFRFDPAASVLRCAESWGMANPLISQFLDRSRDVVLHPDAGLKGRVYRSGHPLWIVSDLPNTGLSSSALAPASDRDGAFIFPVLLDGRTIGVLAFSGSNIREPDDRLLHTVRNIGGQLGRFLHQQQALDALRRSKERFQRLTELSNDWYWEQDHKLRFTDYVGAGALDAEAVLGKTLWELPNLVPGSVDWAEHRSQLGERWSFCDFEFSAVHADGRTSYYSISGEPVFDAAGAFTGYWGTGLDITHRK